MALGLLALSAGCARNGDSADGLPAGSITASLGSDIRSTEPGTNRDANTDTVMMHVFEGLVAFNEQGVPMPMLASRVTAAAGGRVYRFDLRRDVRFHNGALMTAADVVWTWRRYLDPVTGWLCQRDFDGSHGTKVEQVEADGPHSVIFKLSRPDPLLLYKMSSVQCGGAAILHPASVDRAGRWRYPVATGPYRIARWRRGEYLDLQAFGGYRSLPGPRDGYAGGKVAQAPVIRWLIIRDGASRLAALVKGQIDFMSDSTSAELRQVRRYPQLKLESVPNAVVNVILVKPSTPLLADPRIRRALALCIDRRTLVELVTAGTAAPNASLVPVGTTRYDAVQREGIEANLAEARRLLREAHYDGSPIILTTNRRYVDMFDQALLVQAMARRVGLTIDLKVSEWATQVDAYQHGDFQLMSHAYSPRADPWQMYDTVIGGPGAGQTKQWRDPRAVALLAQIAEEADPVKRQASFDRLHRMMIRDTPLIVLFNPADNNAMRRDLHGFRSWILGRARLWGVAKETHR